MIDAEKLDAQARDILIGNDKGKYTIPTEGLYPYQWNWDSALAAIGFAQFDLDRAWTELETLLSGQWSNGMVPHILFHCIDSGYFPGPEVWGCSGPIASSGISQPPIAASMAKLIFDKNPELGKVRLTPLYKPLLSWHQWFMRHRLHDGAVCITHPWESGRDNAPDWDNAMARIDPVGVGEYIRRDTSHVDGAMRPTKYDYDRYIYLVQLGKRLNWNEDDMAAQQTFRVADPTMTFTLLRAHRDLAVLGKALGEDVSALNADIAKLERGADTLWNSELGSYDSRDINTGLWANSISNASFLCWYAGLPAAEMRAVLNNVLSQIQYGIPSLDPADEKFDSKRYWRGPVWGVMNMLIAIGMSEMYFPEGNALRQSTAELIAEHGFAEYFNPCDGTPAGGNSFTWTAAVWLSWASPTGGNY